MVRAGKIQLTDGPRGHKFKYLWKTSNLYGRIYICKNKASMSSNERKQLYLNKKLTYYMSKGIETIFLIINMRRKFKLLDSGSTKRMHTGGGPNGKPEAPTT